MLENRTYDELNVGDSASLTRTLTKDDIDAFAILSGDVNPAHLDEAYARETPFQKVIAHGMWGGTLISTLLGTKLPGPGTIYVGQSLRFMRPVNLGDILTVTVTVKEKKPKNMVTLTCESTNQQGKVVITGEAEIMAPTTKVRRPQAALPQMRLDRLERFEQLMSLVDKTQPVRCAVVYPEEPHTLMAAVESARAGLIVPVLIGSRERISAVASEADLDLSGCEWRDADTPVLAAHAAVEMARANEASAIMQGSIPVHTLLHLVLRHAGGLRTPRRMSHAYVADVPTYSQPLIITDAEVNVRPTLEDKRDIVQNAIDLAKRLKFETPRVAVLSAAEHFNSNLESSTDAAVLCKMHERQQITGGDLDGPMTLTAAIKPEVAKRIYPESSVAGRANILMVPNLEAANMLVRQLAHLSHAEIAGIVLGCKVPVILSNPTDGARTRVASAALARLLVKA
ncbi:bifunctional enoyl-CoA hydratase/phosphate acetyltransferase [Aquabacterium sp.]|uniref:bifunctional enoyl-CoA hydratase/phosphate acetyltransferase n=1 Tax=Aquabacterium sp. TaxID=1872578 RepID=UPI0027B8FD24|nr:bifunctional enoyl-CoA hydratase/phosphate acetyltransferase [Aquabacterium sp.]